MSVDGEMSQNRGWRNPTSSGGIFMTRSRLASGRFHLSQQQTQEPGADNHQRSIDLESDQGH